MKIAIMQPTYIPWVGYFAMMKSVDKFIILDHVQFARRSWQQRNRIILNGKEHLLSLSVKKTDRNTSINNIELSSPYGNFDKHLKTIYQAYSKAPYFNDYFFELEKICEKAKSLSELNILLIEFIKDKLGIKTKLVLSSEINVKGTKSELMYNICQSQNATHYLSAIGSKEYMESGTGFDFNIIKVDYFNYIPNEYRQDTKSFVPYMSVLDLLFNEGENSINIL